MPRNATAQDVADYLLGGYNDSTQISYTYFDPNVWGPIKTDISGLDAEGKQLAKWAMNAWESVADVEFKLATRGASLSFEDHGGGAHAETKANADGTITQATINVSSDWIQKYGAGVDSYTFRTYMHEIGHVLGLGHTGPYNANADYKDAIFSNDSWQLSVMSYLGQDENPNIGASRASNVTPMEADLLAIRKMWGAPEKHYADGDTIWGIGSKLGNYLGDIFRSMANHEKSDAYDLQPITLYIEDGSGHDKIDFSHTGLHQIVDLRPGSISSVLSFKNNMLIAEGTVIEEFVSGDGIDKIIGNNAGNAIWGGGRDDLIKGLGGSDRLWGDAGKDRIFGGSGKDALNGGDHDDLLKGQGGRDKLWGEAGADTLIGGGGNDALYGGDQSDVIRSDAGNDLLDGGEAGDRLRGGSGNDRLFGGSGLDLLEGGDGDDRLDGGESPDELFGGAGADVFVLGLGYGIETVADFVLGEDRIELNAALLADLTAGAAAELARDTDDGDLMLNFGDGNRLLLSSLAGTELTAESFIIA